MNKRSLGALIALNAVLLIALLVVSLITPEAQAQGGRVRRGNYIMISGSTAGRSNQALIYVIELQTSKMIAMFYNSATNQMEVLDGRNMNDDIAGATGGQRH